VNCWIGVERKRNRNVVRVAGEFKLPQVSELLAACDLDHSAVELDLRDLVGADFAGIEALRGLRARGAVLVRVPGYIELKLEAPSTIDPII
jgi:hypothetical protein